MQPLHELTYDLLIKTDMSRFDFAGTLEFGCVAAEPVEFIELNCLELAVWRCWQYVDEQRQPCRFEYRPEQESLRIYLTAATAGPLRLQIEYDGRINDRMAGFYRSRYTFNGTAAHIAVTQFQESDARRAFPCIDQPSAKARFHVALESPPELEAFSNMPVAAVTYQANGAKRVRFQQTPKMSTYLLFFGLGRFDRIQGGEDTRVWAMTIPGLAAFADYGLRFGQKALAYCEDYYAIPFPLPKLDLLAVPDFAFGAMENWGAITFRENLLLNFPDQTSQAGKERICEVIAHEIVHQWFGNLVTPADWKFLWLNESFATYFGYGVVAHYHPDWDIWATFINGQTSSALDRDALQETFPIEIPGGEHVVINSSTAPIIYSKGGQHPQTGRGLYRLSQFSKRAARLSGKACLRCRRQPPPVGGARASIWPAGNPHDADLDRTTRLSPTEGRTAAGAAASYPTAF